MRIGLVDIGVNLTHAQFNADRAQVIDRALDAGVQTMVLTGTDVRSSQAALELARRYPGTLYSTAGVHPHDARRCGPGTIDSLRQLAGQAQVVAIGECGLDYNRDFSPRPVQQKWFEDQVILARELRMPLFLHERDAHGAFVEILSRHKEGLPPAVVHCFTGTGEELDTYLRMGLFIGITGWICDERRGNHLLELVRRIPLDRLMLETDAPFLTPRNVRPAPLDRRNEPAYLVYVLDVVARALGRSREEVAAATTKNARDFFRLP